MKLENDSAGELSIIHRGAFVVFLAGALGYSQLLWLSVFSWMGLAWLFFRQLRFGVYAVFFFATFFHPSGFFPNLFFTIKHFHLALCLICLLELSRRQFWLTFMAGMKGSRLLVPFFLIIFVGFLGSMTHGAGNDGILMTANLLSLLIGSVYVIGLIQHYKIDLKVPIFFFLTGIILQILVNFYNIATHRMIFYLDLFYNNQFGTLVAFGFFYAVYFVIIARRGFFYQTGMFFVLALTITGVMFSCSRTAWISILLGTVIFFYFFYHVFSFRQNRPPVNRRCVAFFLCLLACFVFILSYHPLIRYRVTDFLEIFDFNYLKYTVEDKQNFGFLGILRLNQIYAVGDILLHSPLWGIGFVGRVTDFHGFYFTLLGGSGLIGFFLFFYFIHNISYQLEIFCRRSVQKDPGDLLKVSILCALVTWVLTSLTQTMFVQFSVWINVIAAVSILEKSKSARHE